MSRIQTYKNIFQVNTKYFCHIKALPDKFQRSLVAMLTSWAHFAVEHITMSSEVSKNRRAAVMILICPGNAFLVRARVIQRWHVNIQRDIFTVGRFFKTEFSSFFKEFDITGANQGKQFLEQGKLIKALTQSSF